MSSDRLCGTKLDKTLSCEASQHDKAEIVRQALWNNTEQYACGIASWNTLRTLPNKLSKVKLRNNSYVGSRWHTSLFLIYLQYEGVGCVCRCILFCCHHLESSLAPWGFLSITILAQDLTCSKLVLLLRPQLPSVEPWPHLPVTSPQKNAVTYLT